MRRRHWANLAGALIAFSCGVAQANEGPSQWRTIALGRSLEAAAAITDPYRRAQALAHIARVQAVGDDARATDRTIEQALGATHDVQEAEFRGWVLHDVVLAQIARDDLIGARETADAIQANRPHGAAWAALAEIDVRGGDLIGAQAIATKIRDPGSRSLVLRQLVAVMASRGELEPARNVLRSIDDAFHEAMARGDLAAAEVRAARVQQAHTLAARAPRKHRPEVYGRIALARLAANDLRGAFESAQKISDARDRAIVQGRMAVLRAEAGEKDAARQMLSSAIASLDDAEGAGAAMTLAQLARMRAASGDSAGAHATLRRARAEADRLPAGEERDDALDYIAREQAHIGDSAAALDSALHSADRTARALLVRDVVSLQREATSASALATAKTFDDPLIEAAALFGVLGAQLSRNDQSASGETIEAARAAVARIDAPLKPAAFAALAAARNQIDGGDGGEALFIEALNAADALERADQRSGAYLNIVVATNDRLVFLGQSAAPVLN